MKLENLRTLIYFGAGLVLFAYAGVGGAQSVLATGSDAEVTDDGLHRINPLIMEAAWIKPDLDLSSYSRIYVVPTAVQFRDVLEKNYDARSRIATTEFPLREGRQEWLREIWQQAVDARFDATTYDFFDGVATDVLVVQAMLADVVSHIPPPEAGSYYTYVRDPWVANVLLEIRDGTTGELLGRTNDRRVGEGMLDRDTVWLRTEDLLERWAEVIHERLDQLNDLAGGGRQPPDWARP